MNTIAIPIIRLKFSIRFPLTVLIVNSIINAMETDNNAVTKFKMP